MIGCPICRSSAAPQLEARDENRRCSTLVFEYSRCNACGSIFLTNPPADLGLYYEAGYYQIPSVSKLQANNRKDRTKIDIVNRFAPGPRLLEIGPAFGVFAFAAMQSGYDVDVIERDERCCTFLRDDLGVRVIQSETPHEAVGALSKHDVITLWHVLEHLPDVPAMIDAAARNLVPGGVLVIAVPNPQAAQFALMGRHWPHLDAPRHLSLVPAHTLAALARRHGLDPILETSDDADSRRWNRFGWQRLLMNRFRSRLMQKAMFVAGYPIAALMAPFDCRAMRGSAYTMVLKKVRQ